MFYSNRISQIVESNPSKEKRKMLESIIESVIKKNVSKFEIQTKIAKDVYTKQIPVNIWKKKLKEN